MQRTWSMATENWIRSCAITPREPMSSIYDAQYNDEEYASHRGWGHSTWREAARVAKDAGVGKLFLFHFDPAHSDSRVAESERLAAAEFEAACAAREGSVILALTTWSDCAGTSDTASARRR